MATPILATKVCIPPSRPKAVSRPRLNELLNSGAEGKLTLISAPAGFGKTTLLSEWLASRTHAAAWLSLEEGDGQPARFLAYFVAALQSVLPAVGSGLPAALDSPQPPPMEATLTALLNDVAAAGTSVVVVLDDYHTIDSTPIDQALAYLLEHMPPQMHVVISTREDPQLPLARLRARGQLTELRAADLRFTASEAAQFLNEAMGLQIPAEAVAALERRTEGWVAGLQLAGLSLRGRSDVARFVSAFAGDHRFIVDYLVEEVLNRQPAPVRHFLLETSILDRLSGPLCDAVTGRSDSARLLEVLESANLFVTALDETRHWFRYHPLFAAALAAHLRQERPDAVLPLHRRASDWFAANSQPANAIRHALAARDFVRAADLIEPAVPALRRSRQETTLLGWLRALPDELVRTRPVLGLYHAGSLLQSGIVEGVEARLRDAERWLQAPAAEQANEMVVIDHDEFRRLPGWIANYRAGLALLRGSVTETRHYAELARALLPADDDLGRGAVGALAGLAEWTSGNLVAAEQLYTEALVRLERAGFLSDVLGATIALADIHLDQGRLQEARRVYERGLRLATGQGGGVLRGAADMLVGLAAICCELNELARAEQHLAQSLELGEYAALLQYPWRRRVVEARLLQAHGDLTGAFDRLNEAEQLYFSDFSPKVRPIAALRARLWLAQGDVLQARRWAEEQGLSAGDELTYLREYEHITLARVLLAQASANPTDSTRAEAIGLPARLLAAAEDGKRFGSVIEIEVVRALTLAAQGDKPGALAALGHALTLAEPEGYVRLFVDEGTRMADLLAEARGQGIAPAYTEWLLAAFGEEPAAPPPPAPPRAPSLLEPLSRREMEILRLFRTELSGPEIAGELVIALSTLRTHTKAIYSKLAVNSRRAAVNRALDLHLI